VTPAWIICGLGTSKLEPAIPACRTLWASVTPRATGSAKSEKASRLNRPSQLRQAGFAPIRSRTSESMLFVVELPKRTPVWPYAA